MVLVQPESAGLWQTLARLRGPVKIIGEIQSLRQAPSLRQSHFTGAKLAIGPQTFCDKIENIWVHTHKKNRAVRVNSWGATKEKSWEF